MNRSARIHPSTMAVIAWLPFICGVVYLIARFHPDRTPALAGWPAHSAALIYIMATAGLLALIGGASVSQSAMRSVRFFTKGVLLTACLLVLALFLRAASEHALYGLASIRISDSNEESVVTWDRSGMPIEQKTISLYDTHPVADEIRNISVAHVGQLYGWMPSTQREIISNDSWPMTSYLANWFHTHHPPGLAFIYGPFASNAPFSRFVGFLMFVGCACILGLTGWMLSRTELLGLFFVAMFVGVFQILWEHAYRVSIDLVASVPSFSAVLLYARLMQKKEASIRDTVWDWLFVGALFAVGTGIKYLVVLGPVALWILSCGTKWRVSVCHRALVLIFPSCIILSLGVTYTAAIVGWENLTIFQLVAAVLGRGNGQLLEGQHQLLFRLISELGLPMVSVLVVVTVMNVVPGIVEASRQRILDLVAISILIIPAATVWVTVRYLYPFWPILLIGIGVPACWHQFSRGVQLMWCSSILAFSLTKFIFVVITHG